MDQPYSTYSANYMTPTQQQNPACPYNSGVGGFQGLPQLSGAIPQLSGQVMSGTYPSSGQSQMNNIIIWNKISAKIHISNFFYIYPFFLGSK